MQIRHFNTLTESRAVDCNMKKFIAEHLSDCILGPTVDLTGRADLFRLLEFLFVLFRNSQHISWLEISNHLLIITTLEALCSAPCGAFFRASAVDPYSFSFWFALTSYTIVNEISSHVFELSST